MHEALHLVAGGAERLPVEGVDSTGGLCHCQTKAGGRRRWRVSRSGGVIGCENVAKSSGVRLSGTAGTLAHLALEGSVSCHLGLPYASTPVPQQHGPRTWRASCLAAV